jgi:hypothetical protein
MIAVWELDQLDELDSLDSFGCYQQLSASDEQQVLLLRETRLVFVL